MVIWDFGMCKGRERKGMAAWEQVVRVVVGIGVVEEVTLHPVFPSITPSVLDLHLFVFCLISKV
jgi:hypothetical protein